MEISKALLLLCIFALSSKVYCQNTAYTKIAVALGFPELDDIEVIDLSSDKTKCQNLPKFPYPNNQMTGGLGNGNNPFICGGYEQNNSACYSLENGTWKTVGPFNEGRYFHAMTKSPFPDDGSILFVTGGKSGYATYSKSSEVLSAQGWQSTTPLPIELLEHCMVQINSTSVMVIGGRQGTADADISDKTYIFNSLNQLWTEGPRLKKSRYSHSCSLINKNGQKSIIVAGGIRIDEKDLTNFVRPPVYLDSTELLDLDSTEWRNGPKLPLAISSAAMVEDSEGGVVLIGGFGNGENAVSSLYRLKDTSGNWEKMSQELKTARWYHTAFLIPDSIASCN